MRVGALMIRDGVTVGHVADLLFGLRVGNIIHTLTKKICGVTWGVKRHFLPALLALGLVL